MIRAVAIALLASCWSAPPRVERRTIIRVVVKPCLVQRPPAQPTPTGDVELDDARKLDAYPDLERYVRLVVVPSCL